MYIDLKQGLLSHDPSPPQSAGIVPPTLRPSAFPDYLAIVHERPVARRGFMLIQRLSAKGSFHFSCLKTKFVVTGPISASKCGNPSLRLSTFTYHFAIVHESQVVRKGNDANPTFKR